MTDQERITQLEARIAQLEARIAAAERGPVKFGPLPDQPPCPPMTPLRWPPFQGWKPGDVWCGVTS